jgi:alkyl hydroperoxide reductase subunit AhpC
VVAGKPVLRLPLTAVVQGDCRRLNPSLFDDRWVALCFPSFVEATHMLCLDRQQPLFERAGAVLLAVVPGDLLFQPSFRGTSHTFSVPLLVDPLHRLHRSYGIPVGQLPSKTRTFLIDSSRILRHQVVHEVNMWDMEALRRLIVLGSKHGGLTDVAPAESRQQSPG